MQYSSIAGEARLSGSNNDSNSFSILAHSCYIGFHERMSDRKADIHPYLCQFYVSQSHTRSLLSITGG